MLNSKSINPFPLFCRLALIAALALAAHGLAAVVSLRFQGLALLLLAFVALAEAPPTPHHRRSRLGTQAASMVEIGEGRAARR